ncbi:MAG: ASCH domain-containing protein, partial [Firmicutes bacterium]|nr:ASCH domain-containing protein [Bacillota bacterium]
MTEKEMWRRFCTETGLDPKTPYEAWAFCGGGPFADELAGLVLSGRKTATASAFVAFETAGEPLPEPGCYSVILYDDGSAAGVIRDTKVSLVPFNEVTAVHAYQEGEGTRTLTEWREIHRRAFTPDYQAVGKEFGESGICVLEEFELLYPAIKKYGNEQMKLPNESHSSKNCWAGFRKRQTFLLSKQDKGEYYGIWNQSFPMD